MKYIAAFCLLFVVNTSVVIAETTTHKSCVLTHNEQDFKKMMRDAAKDVDRLTGKSRSELEIELRAQKQWEEVISGCDEYTVASESKVVTDSNNEKKAENEPAPEVSPEGLRFLDEQWGLAGVYGELMKGPWFVSFGNKRRGGAHRLVRFERNSDGTIKIIEHSYHCRIRLQGLMVQQNCGGASFGKQDKFSGELSYDEDMGTYAGHITRGEYSYLVYWDPEARSFIFRPDESSDEHLSESVMYTMLAKANGDFKSKKWKEKNPSRPVVD